MNCERIYNDEVNQCISYRVSKNAFTDWIIKSGFATMFELEIRRCIADTSRRYNLALLYSIPIVMIKSFERDVKNHRTRWS